MPNHNYYTEEAEQGKDRWYGDPHCTRKEACQNACCTNDPRTGGTGVCADSKTSIVRNCPHRVCPSISIIGDIFWWLNYS